MATKSKADMSASDREKAAREGKAVKTSGSDGASFPIENEDDLRRAIKAAGRAKPADRAKVRAHIIRRARALGLMRLIPKDWLSNSDRSKSGSSEDSKRKSNSDRKSN